MSQHARNNPELYVRTVGPHGYVKPEQDNSNVVPDQERLLGTCGWKDGRAWHHDYDLELKVWSV